MGLGDIAGTVLTRYKADTKEHRSELKKLRGEEKKRHKALLEDMEKQNERIDEQIARWGKVAVGIGAAVAAYRVGTSAADEYFKVTQLRSATAGTNVERLKSAVQGLVSETELLRFTQNATTGDFKLSQAQMERVLRGTVALAAKGHDLTEVLERTGQAVREGNVEPLKEYGMVLRTDVNDTMEGSLEIVRAFGNEWEKTGGKVDIAGKSMRQAQVEMNDVLTELKVRVGELVAALAPAIKLLSEAVGGLTIVMGAVFDTRGGKTIADQQAGAALAGMLSDAKSNNSLADRVGAVSGAEALAAWLASPTLGTGGGGGGFRGPYSGGYRAPYQEFWQDGGFVTGLSRPDAGGRGRGQRAAGMSNAQLDLFFEDVEGDASVSALLRRQREQQEAFSRRSRINAAQGVGHELGPAFGQQAEMAGDYADAVARSIELTERFRAVGEGLDRRKSVFAQIFGTPAEIESITTAIQIAGGAFDTFAQSAGAGIDALITGSESFGGAIKHALAEGLRGLAVDMGIQALRHGAYALGSLAFLDGRGAAAHGLAAAQFGAASAAAGWAANELGAGKNHSAWTTSRITGGGRAPAGPATSGLGGDGARLSASAGAGNRTTVVVLDDGFDQMSSAARRNEIRRRLRLGGMTFDSDVVEKR